MKRDIPRRDICYAVGRRARTLSRMQSAAAWQDLADHIENLSEKDIPKFRDLLHAIRAATIYAKRPIPQTE